MQRLTLKFCKSRSDNKGMRDFIEEGLVDFARKNPGTVVYVKPRRHRAPLIVAEYCMCKLSIIYFDSKWKYSIRSSSKNGEGRACFLD
ncbi:unnamed protein product [Protopolystoma xenopodis]|uniref:Large ribosomal subunit protein mL43 n=1 Tax=Protopolystoma xenopodis TaxID=117903 RepID=A0A3S5CV81_9PLAT|nr:unnamed protein product [Protopolystoma xenopodis]